MSLEVKNIVKHFGGIHALDDCSLRIEENTITAIIGPNGSGKSTLFNTISSILKKDKGEVWLKGKNVSKLSDVEIARSGLSRTFQDVRLFRNMTIRDHLSIALSTKDESVLRSFFSPQRINDEEIHKVLQLVGLDKPLETIATDLSYGQRKLLDLAIAIAKPHDILMLDEPVAGVNPKLRGIIKEILKKLKKKGETIILIEHDMNFVMDLASHIIVMDYGKVIAQGPPKKIQNNKQVLSAYLGE